MFDHWASKMYDSALVHVWMHVHTLNIYGSSWSDMFGTELLVGQTVSYICRHIAHYQVLHGPVWAGYTSLMLMHKHVHDWLLWVSEAIQKYIYMSVYCTCMSLTRLRVQCFNMKLYFWHQKNVYRVLTCTCKLCEICKFFAVQSSVRRIPKCAYM